MNLKDLTNTFHSAWSKSVGYGLDAEEEGVKAVVLALRDEFGRIMEPSDDWNRMGVVDVFNDILGAAVEKAPTQALIDLMNMPPLVINTPANPSPQCEWKHAFAGHSNRKWWVRGCTEEIIHREDGCACPSCGLPIVFKEPSHD